MKSKIAVAPCFEISNYTSWLEKIGVPYHILTDNDMVTDFSILLLTGGPDLGVKLERDHIETKWFNEAYGVIPIVGICRGLQLANVCLGGTLIQDLAVLPIKHNSIKIKNVKQANSSFHDIILESGGKMRVNSRHHQAIEKLAEGLNIKASCEDNVIELVEGENSIFVQWHPEREDVFGTECERMISDWIKERL